ncbi:tail fiber protein [uncultured Brevundimonas sp.]|uniref:phage tail protein n=1 Tax=Brevundimonas sp. CEF1 TaxID=3442642 RepID=UPI000F981E80|nr:tail fiber protein [uncultured Brevundimonas sp.]
MTNPYVGEIQIFGFDYAPHTWAFCNGATLPIQQNTALFSLIGIQYGGNGTSNYQLPNLVNRVAVSQGQGPGLTPYAIGETVGASSVTLSITEMPQHSHTLQAANGPDNRLGAPVTGSALSSPVQSRTFRSGVAPNAALHPLAIGIAGNGAAHENRQPVLALNYCIALQGDFPSFN